MITHDDLKLHTHIESQSRIVLAVVFVDVYQQHALPIVQAVLIKRAVTALSGALHHMRALFSLS